MAMDEVVPWHHLHALLAEPTGDAAAATATYSGTSQAQHKSQQKCSMQLSNTLQGNSSQSCVVVVRAQQQKGASQHCHGKAQ